MSEKTELCSFPANEIQALALLYVQSQDLAGKSPSETYKLYKTAYDEIRTERSNQRRQQKTSI